MRAIAVIGLLWALASPAAAQDYTLSGGDRVSVVVFGEDDLSGEYEVDGAGVFSMPLIGPVDAEGQTVRQLEARVREALLDGYLRNPRVSIEVLNYRPFFIMGEVNAPGSYPYRSGLTLLNAVAIAGGYTFRADERDVEITRGDAAPFTAGPQTPVLPGDVIEVDERLF